MQKGPFAKDQIITVRQYNAAFDLDDDVKSYRTKNTQGAYEISLDYKPFFVTASKSRASHSLALFEAKGVFYNESTGKMSAEPITLSSVVDIDALYAIDPQKTYTVNLNLLTTLASKRIVRYMKKR